MQNLSHENEFDLPENEPVGGTHFHMNGFSRKLVLTHWHKITLQWPIIAARAYKMANGTNIFLRLLCK